MKRKITLLFAISIILGNNLISQEITQEITGTVKQLSKMTTGGYDSYGITALENNWTVNVGRSYNAFDLYQTRTYIEWDLSFLYSVDHPVITSAKIDMFYMNALVPSGGSVYNGGSFLIEKPSGRLSIGENATTWNALKADTAFTRTIPSNFTNNWITSITGNTSIKKTTSPLVYKTFVELVYDMWKSNACVYLSLLNTNENSNGLIFVNTSTYPIKLTITYKSGVPPPPTNLIASNITCSGCDLSWSPSANATSYNVYQDGEQIASDIKGTQYSVTGLSTNTPYNFEVAAFFTGESPHSAGVPVTIEGPSALVDLSYHTWGGQYILLWNPSSNAAWYTVTQSYPTTSSWTQTTTNSSYALGVPPINQMYVYNVIPYSSNGCPGSGATTGFGTYDVPSPPTNLDWHPWGAYVLTWSPPSSGSVAGYYVYQTSPDYWKRENATTSFGMSNLPINQVYTFKVTAYNDNGIESEGATTGFSTYTVPPAPTNLAWHYWGAYVLTWTASSGGYVSGYNVYQTSPTSWQRSTTSTTFGIGPLPANQMYSYRVTAFNSNGMESPDATIGFSTGSSMLKNAPSDSLLVNNRPKADFFINPSDNKLWVEGIYDFDISITDMNGKELLTQHNVNGNVDISSFKPGVYVIQIKSGSNFFIKKVVKQ